MNMFVFVTVLAWSVQGHLCIPGVNMISSDCGVSLSLTHSSLPSSLSSFLPPFLPLFLPPSLPSYPFSEDLSEGRSYMDKRYVILLTLHVQHMHSKWTHHGLRGSLGRPDQRMHFGNDVTVMESHYGNKYVLIIIMWYLNTWVLLWPWTMEWSSVGM